MNDWVVKAPRTLLFSAIVALAGCGEELGVGEESQQSVTSADTPFAYVYRDVGNNAQGQQGNASRAQASTADFQPGARLIVRDAISSETSEIEVLAEAFAGYQYDVKDLNVSSDGKSLVFSARSEQEGDTWNLYEYTFETHNVRRLIQDDELANSGNDTNASFSNGDKIVFSSDRHLFGESGAGESVLFVMGRDGSGLAQITDGLQSDVQTTTLKDGHIVFMRVPSNGCGNDSDVQCVSDGSETSEFSLYQIAPDGGDLAALAREQNISDSVDYDLQLKDLVQGGSGNILAIAENRSSRMFGGDIVALRGPSANSADVSGGFSAQSEPAVYEFLNSESITSSEVPESAEEASVNGWYSAFWPYRDGSQRMLVSWSQCIKQNDRGAARACQEGDDIEGVNPRYGIWVYDTENDTRQPILRAKLGRVYSEVALGYPNNGEDLRFDDILPPPVDPVDPVDPGTGSSSGGSSSSSSGGSSSSGSSSSGGSSSSSSSSGGSSSSGSSSSGGSSSSSSSSGGSSSSGSSSSGGDTGSSSSSSSSGGSSSSGSSSSGGDTGSSSSSSSSGGSSSSGSSSSGGDTGSSSSSSSSGGSSSSGSSSSGGDTGSSSSSSSSGGSSSSGSSSSGGDTGSSSSSSSSGGSSSSGSSSSGGDTGSSSSSSSSGGSSSGGSSGGGTPDLGEAVNAEIYTLEDVPVGLGLSVPQAADTAEAGDVVISNVPAGALFNIGFSSGSGEWTVSADQLPELIFTPVVNSGNDVIMPTSVTFTDGDRTQTFDGQIEVIVEAVVDHTDVSVTVTSEPGSSPAGTINAGTIRQNQVVHGTGGNDYIIITGADQNAGSVSAGSGNDTVRIDGWGRGQNVSVTGDGGNDTLLLNPEIVRSRTSSGTGSGRVTFTTGGSLVYNNFSRVSEEGIDLNQTRVSLSVSLTDTDGSEAITSVVLSNLPLGATVANASLRRDGWKLNDNAASEAVITLSSEFRNDFELTVTVTNTDTDPDSGAIDTNETRRFVSVDVDQIPDPVPPKECKFPFDE